VNLIPPESSRRYRPRIIGHRGAAGLSYENSLSAVKTAIEHGVDVVEVDIQVSRDGCPMVFHDRYLDRLTYRSGYIHEWSFRGLRRIRLRNGEVIPTVQEVLDLCRSRIPVILEIKSERAFPPLKELLRDYENDDRVLAASFDHASLLSLKNSHPGLRTIALMEGDPVLKLGFLRDARADMAGMSFDTLGEDTIRTFHGEGIDFMVWTVDQPMEMKRAVRARPWGIATNYPDRLAMLLHRKRSF